MKDNGIVAPTELSALGAEGSIAEAADLGRQIGAGLQKAAAHVLETARLCELGFRRHRSHGLPALLRAANMNRSTFMKYVAIAGDLRLRQIEQRLPPSFTTIHQISQLTDEEFDEAVRAELIYPNVRRAEIEGLRKPHVTNTKVSTAEKLPEALKQMAPGSRFEFVVPNDIPAAGCAQMQQILHKLHAKFGIKIVMIKELDAASKAVATPAVPPVRVGSPVNRPPARPQPFAPPGPGKTVASPNK